MGGHGDGGAAALLLLRASVAVCAHIWGSEDWVEEEFLEAQESGAGCGSRNNENQLG